MCLDDYEPVRAYAETWRMARKQHLCVSCGHAIERGTIYAEATGIDCGGDPFRLRACGRCMAQQDAIRQETEEQCHGHTVLCPIEEIAKHVRDSGMAWVTDEVAAAFAASKYTKGAN